MPSPVKKIVSGGQSGVDRAALDAGLELGLPVGGWCPKGRKAEDGMLPLKYPLVETPLEDYAQRTEWNVRDSDATLILAAGRLTAGTALTEELAALLAKPCLVVDLNAGASKKEIIDWLERYEVQTLNVAGPRESLRPGIYQAARALLKEVFGDEN